MQVERTAEVARRATRRRPASIERIFQVRRRELPVVGWSWLYIFAILSSYYVMRPIREQMGVSGGIENLPWLFTANFGCDDPAQHAVRLSREATAAGAVHPDHLSFFHRQHTSCSRWRFTSPIGEQAVWIGRFFFVWLSVFNLFVVSIFWQAIVDVFTSEQGKRLFGFIAAGATIGAIVGSGATALLARSVPTWGLLIGAAMLLEIAVFSVRRALARLRPLDRKPLSQSGEETIGGSIAGGHRACRCRSPYLMNVSLFLLLFSITIDVSLFRAGECRGEGVSRSRRADRVLRERRPRGERAHTGDPALSDRADRACLRRRDGARIAAAPQHPGIRGARLRADDRGCRAFPGPASRRQFRHRAADAGGSVHRAAARGPL